MIKSRKEKEGSAHVNPYCDPAYSVDNQWIKKSQQKRRIRVGGGYETTSLIIIISL